MHRINIVSCHRGIASAYRTWTCCSEYPMDLHRTMIVFVEVSGLLKALAVNLMKIANDFRIMNSGSGGGIGELHLKAMQQGSTIMPGKVNPVIPEMTMQCAMRIIANDTAYHNGSSSRENLNSMPFYHLLQTVS